MVRKAIVAGQFYSGSFGALDKEIKDCFEHKKGPAALPGKRENRRIMGVVAPHAGYMFSGPCAAWVYKEIAESRFPDLFVLIGLSHSGFGSCVSLEDWETPFGIVKTDKEFCRKLMENSGLKVNEKAHQNEHSIEVQLPFLQFACRDYLDRIRIAAVIASPDIGYSELASAIAKTAKDSRKDVCVIASSDFTHYGINYGYLPFHKDVKENMYKMDNDAIELLKKLKAAAFLSYTDEKEATICGRYPIAVMIETCKLLGATEARLAQYYTSGDIVGDYSSAVGYAGIIVE